MDKAGHGIAWVRAAQPGLRLRTHRVDHRAAGMKPATRRRVDGVGWIAGEWNPLGTMIRIHRGHGSRQCLGVRMARRLEQLFGRTHLHHFAEVHHHYAVADIAHHMQIVADKDVGETELRLEIEKQVKHLRLNRFVEGRDRFVKNDQPWLEGEGTRNIDALTLAA